MINLTPFLATATIALAMAFTISCSSGGGGGGNGAGDDGSDIQQQQSSSSGGGYNPQPSSSSGGGYSSGGIGNSSSSGPSSSSTVLSFCGGQEYTPTSELRCQSDVIQAFCGSNWYNASDVNQRCQNNILEAKCGASWLNVLTQRCGVDNVIETICGIGWYDASDANLRCQNNILETKCGASWYDALTQVCWEGFEKYLDGLFVTDCEQDKADEYGRAPCDTTPCQILSRNGNPPSFGDTLLFDTKKGLFSIFVAFPSFFIDYLTLTCAQVLFNQDDSVLFPEDLCK